MGYTHYFPHKETTQEKWDAIVKDCRKLFEKRSIDLVIGRYDGQYPLTLNELGEDNEICFNGLDVMAHETFILRLEGFSEFHFCKTARKPYDLLVCACLIVYMFHSEDTMELSSDGSWEDWTPAMEFVAEVLGANYVMKFKMCEKVEI